MARGGKRTGTPGTAYSNRSDLNTAPSGGQYGDKAASQARLDAVPLQPAAQPQVQQVQPQSLVPPGALTRPTERPGEPVTAGLGEVGAPNVTLAVLRAAYQLHPSRDLLRLILDEQETRG